MVTVTQILFMVYKIITVTSIMRDLMTEHLWLPFASSYLLCFDVHCDTGDNIIDAGITNNDTGYRTQIAKLGMHMMTLQNDKIRLAFAASNVRRHCINKDM